MIRIWWDNDNDYDDVDIDDKEAMILMMMTTMMMMMTTSRGGGENMSCLVWGPGEKVSCNTFIFNSFLLGILSIIWGVCAGQAALSISCCWKSIISGLVALLGFSPLLSTSLSPPLPPSRRAWPQTCRARCGAGGWTGWVEGAFCRRNDSDN